MLHPEVKGPVGVGVGVGWCRREKKTRNKIQRQMYVPAVGLAQWITGKVVHPLGLVFLVSGQPVCLQVGVMLG